MRTGTTWRPALLAFGFCGSVMADPVSSVTYAIEAAARQLEGRLDLLLLTMGLVVAAIAVIAGTYWQLVGEYPDGGGSAEAAGDVFGDGWAFLPLGALVVDFVLTIAVSVAAASAALIAWWPALERHHLAMGLALLTLVTALVVAGARGRLALAAMTSAFVLCAAVVVGGSLDSGLETATSVAGRNGSDGGSLLLVLLAMSGAMALATGIEAPSSAIAELDVGSRRRRRIGRLTLVATVVVVTLLTITLTVLASGVEPRETDTLLAAVVRGAVGDGAGFAVFQVTSALLLLAAAGSSLQAGPGIVRALSGSVDGRGSSILPAWTGRSTGEGVPWLAVLAFALVAAVVMALAGADEQALVVFYAASVFLGFAFGIAAMARINLRRRAWGALVVNAIGLVVTSATLVASVSRGWPIVPLATSVAIATALWLAWRRSGRPPLRIARTD